MIRVFLDAIETDALEYANVEEQLQEFLAEDVDDLFPQERIESLRLTQQRDRVR
jgi:hypothetical protein